MVTNSFRISFYNSFSKLSVTISFSTSLSYSYTKRPPFPLIASFSNSSSKWSPFPSLFPSLAPLNGRYSFSISFCLSSSKLSLCLSLFSSLAHSLHSQHSLFYFFSNSFSEWSPFPSLFPPVTSSLNGYHFLSY